MAQRTNQAEQVQLLHISRRTQLVVEQLAQYNQDKRHQKTDSQIGHHRLALCLRIDNSCRTSLIQHRIIGSVACLLDLCLGSFLQEESVVVVINTIITLNSYHLQLLSRQILDIFLHIRIPSLQITLLYLQRGSHAANHLIDSGFHVLNVLGIFGIIDILLAQLAPLNAEVVELLHQRQQHRLIQPQRCRCDDGTAFDIGFQIVSQVVKISLPQTQRHILLVILRDATHQLAGIRTDINKFIFLSKIGHGALAYLQRILQMGKLLVDKTNRVVCHLVLFLQIFKQIDLRQLIDKLTVPLWSLARERQRQHRTTTPDKADIQTPHKLAHQRFCRAKTEEHTPRIDHLVRGHDDARKEWRFDIFAIVHHSVKRKFLIGRSELQGTIL